MAARFLVLLFAVVASGRVVAHPLLENSCWVVVAPDRLLVRVTATVREIVVAQGLNTNAFDLAEFRAAAAKHAGYLAAHLHITADGQSLKSRLLKQTFPKQLGADPAEALVLAADLARVTFDFEFPLAAPARELEFAHTMLQEFAYAPNTPWDVTYDFRLKRADEKEQRTAKLKMGVVFAWHASSVAADVRRLNSSLETHPTNVEKSQSLLTSAATNATIRPGP